MKIALISDGLTQECLQRLCTVVPITSSNYKWNLWYRRPDFLFVESAWCGYKDSWKYKIAAYPDYPCRSNSSLAKVVSYAQRLGVPTVFWNKEDGVHFERFIDSARLFDYIFTVDENSIPKYKAALGEHTPINTLMFSVEPSLHQFSGFNFRYKKANFVGSYSSHIHARRRAWQHMLFKACELSGLGVVAFDRNSKRKSSHYRFPVISGLEVVPSVSHANTADVYKNYLVSLNVNTVEDSTTMFSRRFIEVLACGGIAVTTPSLAVEQLFGDYCHIVHEQEACVELFDRLKYGPSGEDLERARAGAKYVSLHHTWAHRLQKVCEVIGL